MFIIGFPTLLVLCEEEDKSQIQDAGAVIRGGGGVEGCLFTAEEALMSV